MPYADNARALENKRRYYIANQARIKAWRSANRGAIQASRRRYRYGIDATAYEKLWQAQGGCCAVCSESLAGAKLLAIDHDHACCPGERSCGACIRGILCRLCNAGLGCARDDPATLRRMAAYIESHPLKPKPQMRLFGDH